MNHSDPIAFCIATEKRRFRRIGAGLFALSLVPLLYLHSSPSVIKPAVEQAAAEPELVGKQARSSPVSAERVSKAEEPVAKTAPEPAPGWLLEEQPRQLRTQLSARSESREFISYTHRDIDGGDFQTLKGTTHQECEARCASNGECRSYTFNTWQNVCFLKSSIGFLRLEPQGISGVLASEDVQTDTRRPVIQRKRSRGLPGEPYRAVRTTGFDHCAIECLNDTKCVGFNFARRDRSCSLLESVGNRPLTKSVASDSV